MLGKLFININVLYILSVLYLSDWIRPYSGSQSIPAFETLFSESILNEISFDYLLIKVRLSLKDYELLNWLLEPYVYDFVTTLSSSNSLCTSCTLMYLHPCNLKRYYELGNFSYGKRRKSAVSRAPTRYAAGSNTDTHIIFSFQSLDRISAHTRKRHWSLLNRSYYHSSLSNHQPSEASSHYLRVLVHPPVAIRASSGATTNVILGFCNDPRRAFSIWLGDSRKGQ